MGVIEAWIYDRETTVGRFDVLHNILSGQVSYNSISNSKIVKFGIFVPSFFNFESTCDLAYVPASIYDRKVADRRFDIIHVILRSLSLAQSRLKIRNAPIRRIGSRWVNSVLNPKKHHFCKQYRNESFARLKIIWRIFCFKKLFVSLLSRFN